MENRLYRSRTERMLGGVCGGLAEYLALDPTLVRLFFALLALGTGLGVLLYLAFWIIVPERGEEAPPVGEPGRPAADEVASRVAAIGTDLRSAVQARNPQAAVTIGVALMALGAVFLLRTTNPAWLWWLDWDRLWPLLLIVAGAALLWRRSRGEDDGRAETGPTGV